jgi:FecR protein.
MVVRTLRRVLLASLAVAAGISTSLIAGGVGSAATNADWTGHWAFTDYCTSGISGCPGTYVFDIDLVQTGTAVTGTGSPYTSTGTASGSSYTFTAMGSPPYTATFHMTMSADGKSASGDATDYQGRVFTVTATGNGKPPTSDRPTTTTTPPTSTTPVPPPTLPKLPAIDPSKATGRMQSIAGANFTVIRDGKRYTATKDSLLQVGDILETGKDTLAAIEFAIGGRVGINGNSKVTIVGDRDVESGQTGPRKVILNKGRIWVNEFASPHSDPQSGGPPALEITTNGGVTGIRG